MSMRILALSSRPPWPPTRADQMTVDKLVRYLAGRGHEIDLACFVETSDEDRALRDGLGAICRRIETLTLPRWRSYLATARSLPTRLPMQTGYFEDAAMHRLVARLVARERYDLVYTHLIRMAEYSRRLALPKVLGMQISQALNYRRMVAHAADPLRRFFYRIEELKARPYEAQMCRDFDRVLLTGQRDIDELAESGPVDKAMVCPHGQDIPPLERVRAAAREPGAIILCGVMATNTNVDAATWFARDIFPLVEKRVPHATFYIVGRKPRASVQALARDRIKVIGEVPDVYDWFCRAEVSVDPLRMGAGMQNKIVQAMAAELPVVATTVANEGIGANPEQIILRDEAEPFADAVVALLNDAERRASIGRAARAFVEKHWTWEAHFDRMHLELEKLARHHDRNAHHAPHP